LDIGTRLKEAVALEKAIHHQVKQALRKDRVRTLHLQADEMQRLLEEGKVAEVYRMANRMCGVKRLKKAAPVTPEGRLPLTDAQELQVWGDWLMKERNMRPPGEDADVYRGLPLAFQLNEIRAALSSLKSKKAASPFAPPIIAWQACSEILLPFLHKAFTKAGPCAFPSNWHVAGLFWIPKPGRTSRQPDAYRDICLVHPAAKIWSSCVLARVKPFLIRSVLPCHYGFLPRKGVTEALVASRDLQQRCFSAKRNLLIASCDLKQAFYRLDRTMLLDSLAKRLGDEATTLLVARRYEKIIYRLEQGTAALELEAPEGIVVGDSLGPLLFVIFQDTFARRLQEERRKRRLPALTLEATVQLTHIMEGPCSVFQLLSGPVTAWDASDVIYADDHDMHRPFVNWGAARAELSLLREVQIEHKLVINLQKSSVLMIWHGEGSMLNRRKLSHSMKLDNGEVIPVVQQQSQLGSMRTSTPNLMAAFQCRAAKASKTRSAYRRILGNRNLPTSLKLRFLEVWVTSSLFHGFELAIVSEHLLQHMESTYMRFVRGVTKQFPCEGGPSNNAVREQWQICSVESRLRVRRLKWWRKQAKFLAKGDRTVALNLLGTLKWDGVELGPSHFRHQLQEDVRLLASHYPHFPLPETCTHWEALAWLNNHSVNPAKCKEFVFNKSTHSSCSQELVPCNEPGCAARLESRKALISHKVRVHGYRNPLRRMVQGNVCPACDKRYLNHSSAVDHVTRRCKRAKSAAFRLRVEEFIVSHSEQAHTPSNPLEEDLSAGAQWGFEPEDAGGGGASSSTGVRDVLAQAELAPALIQTEAPRREDLAPFALPEGETEPGPDEAGRVLLPHMVLRLPQAPDVQPRPRRPRPKARPAPGARGTLSALFGWSRDPLDGE
jgi:hypothetical protein